MGWKSSAEVARPIRVAPPLAFLFLLQNTRCFSRNSGCFFESLPRFRRPHGVNPKVHTPIARARIRARQSVSVFRLHPSPPGVVSLFDRLLGVKVWVNRGAGVGYTRG